MQIPALLLVSAAAFLVPAPSLQDDACTGGPGGDFDWVIRAGTTLVFDTQATQILGGPGGMPLRIQSSVRGRVQVRDLILEQGATLRATGPYPLRICATGRVEVSGLLDVSGFDARPVATLNTGHIPELGGVGGPGGGGGGDTNVITTASTPGGSPGHGPLEGSSAGGGGESACTLTSVLERPGGGGGGRFAADQAGLVAEQGCPGSAGSSGAISGLSPAAGGAPGVGPFVDGDPANDFFGVRPLLDANGEIGGLIRGELARLWAGYGGGGGGNAIPSRTFPNPQWSFSSDPKGGPGGGGGGALHVRALGPIVFGAQGTIRANGGKGGTGEKMSLLEPLGGCGGSGSGGHVVLESASGIDFTDGDPLGTQPRDWIEARGGPRVVDQGPAGAPCGTSFGGAGGAGVIQLHVPLAIFSVGADPTAGIVIPEAALGSANPLAEVALPAPSLLLPSGSWLGPLPADAFVPSGTVVPETAPARRASSRTEVRVRRR